MDLFRGEGWIELADPVGEEFTPSDGTYRGRRYGYFVELGIFRYRTKRPVPWGRDESEIEEFVVKHGDLYHMPKSPKISKFTIIAAPQDTYEIVDQRYNVVKDGFKSREAADKWCKAELKKLGEAKTLPLTLPLTKPKTSGPRGGVSKDERDDAYVCGYNDEALDLDGEPPARARVLKREFKRGLAARKKEEEEVELE